MRSFGTAGVVAGMAGIQLAAFVAESPKMEQSDPLQGELKRGSEHAEAIHNAAAEVNGRCLFEVLRGTRDFSDAEAEMYALGEHLIVEDEVVGVFEQWQFRKDLAAEGTVSGVVLRQLDAEEKIFKCCEQPVGNIFIQRHTATQGSATDNSRSQH